MYFSPEYIAARNAALIKDTAGWAGHDELDPRGPSGHAYGIRVSARLTSDYRSTHRTSAVDITPQDVIDCLVRAGIKSWVLMGLHGYVGYLPTPRATQDVAVMVSHNEKTKATNAIAERWPMLEKVELAQVVRFLDRGDKDPQGRARPVVDLMFPASRFQQIILEQHVIIDPETKNRIPTVEAAIVAKYAALISPYRDWDKKQQDAVDLRRLIKTNQPDIDRQKLCALSNEVWEQGGQEILIFFDLALQDQPFPI